jgi:hypothetical protein
MVILDMVTGADISDQGTVILSHIRKRGKPGFRRRLPV